VATGSSLHKSLITNSQTIIANVIRLLHHSKPQIRIAALWVIINLTWTDDPESLSRREIFKGYGFPDLLNQLFEKEENIDVSERIKTALLNFNPRSLKENHEMKVDNSGSEPLLFGSVYDDDTGDYVLGDPV
jgi:hypothetical protein